MPPIAREKLTKEFLLTLLKGYYVVSNCYRSVGENKMVPRFQELVSAPQKRIAQWQRVKNAGADGRLCFVYASPDAYQASAGARSFVRRHSLGITHSKSVPRGQEKVLNPARTLVGISPRIETRRRNMAKQGNPPVEEFEAGTIRAAIWRNELEQDGRPVVRHSIKIEKRYRARQTNEWTSTDQYFPDDLPKLQLVVAKAFEYVSLKRS